MQAEILDETYDFNDLEKKSSRLFSEEILEIDLREVDKKKGGPIKLSVINDYQGETFFNVNLYLVRQENKFLLVVINEKGDKAYPFSHIMVGYNLETHLISSAVTGEFYIESILDVSANDRGITFYNSKKKVVYRVENTNKDNKKGY